MHLSDLPAKIEGLVAVQQRASRCRPRDKTTHDVLGTLSNSDLSNYEPNNFLNKNLPGVEQCPNTEPQTTGAVSNVATYKEDSDRGLASLADR